VCLQLSMDIEIGIDERVHPPPAVVAAHFDIESSPSDKRKYKHITLSNGLQCLLIEDEPPQHTPAWRDGVPGPNPRHRRRGSSSSDSSSSASSDGSSSSGDEEDSDEEEKGKGRAKNQESSRKSERPAAAALSVHVGHFSDPEHVPGLAHFLEHMLFMGTEEYPDENEWESWLADRGGWSNASTDCEMTVYQFEVESSSLSEALRRFASFFTCPLFKASAMRREIRAVDSEFKDQELDDEIRQTELLLHTVRKDHPMHKFGWGNLKSLETIPERDGIDVRKEVMEFHRQMYTAPYMRLVVLGRDLEELERDVLSYYSAIVASPPPPSTASGVAKGCDTMDVTPTSFDPPQPIPDAETASSKSRTVSNMELRRDYSNAGLPFAEDTLGHVYRAVGIRSSNAMELTWALPAMKDSYSTKVTTYLGNLVGHEGRGSLLHRLKQKAWATELFAGVESNGLSRNSSCWLFSVTLTLTDDGMAHWEEVCDLLFQFIGLIRKSGPQRYFWEELKCVAETSFQYLVKDEPVEYVEMLAGDLLLFPREHVISNGYLYSRYDPDGIRALSEQLRPDKSRITLMSRQFKGTTDQTEPWFGIEYSSESIKQDLLSTWEQYAQTGPRDPELQLPKPNPYIPLELAIKKDDKDSKALSPAGSSVSSASIATGLSVLNNVEPNYDPASIGNLRCQRIKSLLKGDRRVPQPVWDMLEGVDRVGHPEMLLSTERCKVWYLKDSTFLRPHAVTYMRLSTPLAYRSPEDAVKLNLIVDILDDVLTDHTYNAELAGLSVSLGSVRRGFEVKLTGFDHKLPVLARTIIAALRDMDLDAENVAFCERFKNVREELLNTYRHRHFEPMKQAEHMAHRMQQREKFSDKDLAIACERMEPSDLRPFRDAIIRYLFIDLLAHGNLLRSEASELAAMVETELSFRGVPLHLCLQERIIEPICGQSVLLSLPSCNVDETNEASVVHYHVGRSNARVNYEWLQLRLQYLNDAYGIGSISKDDATHAWAALVQYATTGVHPTYQPFPSALSGDVLLSDSFFGRAQAEPSLLVPTNMTLVTVLRNLMWESCFDQLRTKEQLGYQVSSYECDLFDVAGFSFSVQSNSYSAAYLTSRIAAYVVQFRDELLKIPDDTFRTQIDHMQKQRCYPFNNLSEQSDFLWDEVYSEFPMFDRSEADVLELCLVTKSNLVAFYDTWFMPAFQAGVGGGSAFPSSGNSVSPLWSLDAPSSPVYAMLPGSMPPASVVAGDDLRSASRKGHPIADWNKRRKRAKAAKAERKKRKRRNDKKRQEEQSRRQRMNSHSGSNNGDSPLQLLPEGLVEMNAALKVLSYNPKVLGFSLARRQISEVFSLATDTKNLSTERIVSAPAEFTVRHHLSAASHHCSRRNLLGPNGHDSPQYIPVDANGLTGPGAGRVGEAKSIESVSRSLRHFNDVIISDETGIDLYKRRVGLYACV